MIPKSERKVPRSLVLSQECIIFVDSYKMENMILKKLKQWKKRKIQTKDAARFCGDWE